MTTTTSTLRQTKSPSEQGLLPVVFLGLLAGLSLLAAVLVPIKRMLRRRRRRRAADDRAHHHHHHHHDEEPGERTSLLSSPTLLSATAAASSSSVGTNLSSSSSPVSTNTSLRTADDDGPREHDGLLTSTDRPTNNLVDVMVFVLHESSQRRAGSIAGRAQM